MNLLEQAAQLRERAASASAAAQYADDPKAYREEKARARELLDEAARLESQAKAVAASGPRRTASIAKIHIGKSQLLAAGILPDEASYRALLKAYGGADSSTRLTDAGIGRVLARMVALGAVFAPPARAGKPPHSLNSRLDTALQLKKIAALLADMKLPWGYAAQLARHMYKLDALAFCDSRQLSGIIAALAKRQQKQRGG